MLTPEQLIDRVRDAVDGVEVAGTPRAVALAMLRAGMTLAGIALSRLNAADREFQLRDLEGNARRYLAALAARRLARSKWH